MDSAEVNPQFIMRGFRGGSFRFAPLSGEQLVVVLGEGGEVTTYLKDYWGLVDTDVPGVDCREDPLRVSGKTVVQSGSDEVGWQQPVKIPPIPFGAIACFFTAHRTSSEDRLDARNRNLTFMQKIYTELQNNPQRASDKTFVQRVVRRLTYRSAAEV